MAWNEPGNGKDPWDKDGDQPNNLDEIVQGWQRKLSGVVGGGRGRGGPSTAGGYVLIVLLIVAWGLTHRVRRHRQRHRGGQRPVPYGNADGGSPVRVHPDGRAVPSH